MNHPRHNPAASVGAPTRVFLLAAPWAARHRPASLPRGRAEVVARPASSGAGFLRACVAFDGLGLQRSLAALRFQVCRNASRWPALGKLVGSLAHGSRHPVRLVSCSLCEAREGDVLPAGHLGAVTFKTSRGLACTEPRQGGASQQTPEPTFIPVTDSSPNQAASVDAPTALLFAVLPEGRRATEHQRWARTS